jgi:hypothetical protein
LHRCGVTTITPEPDPSVRRCTRLWPESTRTDHGDWYVVGGRSDTPWTDLNPANRCDLPEFLPTVPSGVPSPIQLSRWKIGALRILATLEVYGRIDRAKIKQLGCDPSRWTRGPEQWLDPVGNGLFVRSDRIPKFENQHANTYAEILASIRAEASAAPIEKTA